MLAVAFFPHRLNAIHSSEATLSQELHTTRLLLLHVSVEYRWQHIGLSPVSRPNGYGCGFVSQPSEPDGHLSAYPALQRCRFCAAQTTVSWSLYRPVLTERTKQNNRYRTSLRVVVC